MNVIRARNGSAALPEREALKRFRASRLILSCALLAALVAGPDASEARTNARSSYLIGTAAAAAGEKASGVLEVPDGDGGPSQIPVVVINGARTGPTLAVAAGAHGTEYASIVAVTRLIQGIDPKRLRGRLILLPLINVNSFEQKVLHVNPVDRKSMNGAFPGRLDGSQTQRASAVITHDVIDRADYVVDLHGGDIDEDLRPYSYWHISGNEAVDRRSLEMVQAFGLDNIVVAVHPPIDPGNSRTLSLTAISRGKPSMTAEAGHSGTVEPDDVDRLVQGTQAVMRRLAMLDGASTPPRPKVWMTEPVTIKAPRAGMFIPRQSRGTYVAAGTVLGDIQDYYGNPAGEIVSPVAGIILYIRGVPSLAKGDSVGSVGQLAAATALPRWAQGLMQDDKAPR